VTLAEMCACKTAFFNAACSDVRTRFHREKICPRECNVWPGLSQSRHLPWYMYWGERER
jgi:hypothetical protein